MVVERLWPWHHEQAAELGFCGTALCITEQVHGCEVAVVESPQSEVAAGADGLISNVPGLVIGIYVADCCAVYLADARTGAFGVVHSGKKGSELGITARAIALMQQHYGTNPVDLVVQLSPCIRPPAYEIDFAAQIRQQALDAVVVAVGQRRPRVGWQWAPGRGPYAAYRFTLHAGVSPPYILCNTPTVVFFFFNTHPGVFVPIFAPKISPSKLYLILFDPVRLCGYSYLQ